MPLALLANWKIWLALGAAIFFGLWQWERRENRVLSLEVENFKAETVIAAQARQARILANTLAVNDLVAGWEREWDARRSADLTAAAAEKQAAQAQLADIQKEIANAEDGPAAGALVAARDGWLRIVAGAAQGVRPGLDPVP